MATRRYLSASEDETVAIGRQIAASLPANAALLLDGDLGAGKTVLTRGVALHLGIDPNEIQSPTFTLVREHSGPGGRLIHADLYRLKPEEAEAIGLEELLVGPGLKVIEWSERLPFEVSGAVRFLLRRVGERGREIVEE
ncbi:MAG TPA: tRNA (adenosine(37)-N6)-threonylcarbamoyltransferase complex ATPase subunit type 1 TsaE [Thermoanaerobaculia bacterium]|nr:tRNA (adenosine(37)-N6)-threonylcarbamoyltransferase complex ATPase subunit type 1 TsaE [Thermoanaerobaculia bacterium]